MLFQLGSLTFRVVSPNLHQTERRAEADFAEKDVIGALRPLEAVGEGDNRFTLRGRLFPRRFGGLGAIDLLDSMRVAQEPHILVRGDGRNFGWWVIREIRETSDYLDRGGVGRVIEYEVELQKAPVGASATAYATTLFRLFA